MRPQSVAPARQASADSVWATAGRHYNQHGWLFRRFMGPHHRALWATPVRVPVFRLASADKDAGPLKPTKLGGGFQSTSLTLTAADGRTYALRSLDKDPARILPKFYQKTFVTNALRDGTSAGNPYGALVVPPLAQALGVPHTHPRIFYVDSSETRFTVDDANERLRGKMVLLEEKYNGKQVSSPLLPQAREFISDEDMRKRIYASPADRPDQQALLRARLLDVLIGDWDRHSGQWQWAVLPDPAHPTRRRYAPVPKDRDQTFYRVSDGLVGWLGTRKFTVRHLVTFKKRIHDVKALTGQGRFVDQRGMPELTRRDFDQAARYVQQHLPDSTLARAVHRLPPPVYAHAGKRLLRDLKHRRDQLPAVARKYYLLKARQPIVAGTDQPDFFQVQRTPDSTTVRIYSRALGADSLYFQRTYFSKETRRLTLEGLGGNDTFEITGRGMPLVLHGGADQDVVRPANAPRVEFSQEANGNLDVPRPRTEKEAFENYDRLADE
ncbi:hypothetical protein [Hymenobacter sp. BT559]|uniref:hypothetical protein n=1 Tax=Hymenobacter sp. BT559 TaxID=2795729 RepID=UPI0018EB3C5A|nr:hypothetical protein [Hymenobacter sp. BT559]MBJ6142973.1 hypothetical protein [Hymenobacter sp. BT559]